MYNRDNIQSTIYRVYKIFYKIVGTIQAEIPEIPKVLSTPEYHGAIRPRACCPPMHPQGLSTSVSNRVGPLWSTSKRVLIEFFLIHFIYFIYLRSRSQAVVLAEALAFLEYHGTLYSNTWTSQRTLLPIKPHMKGKKLAMIDRRYEPKLRAQNNRNASWREL